jgi:hypothetical protein
MWNRDDLKQVLWWVTGSIFVISGGILFIGSRDKDHWPPTIGDLGDFIGGMGTLLALVWAIGGFLFNEMQIRETQKDIQDQLEIFRSAVGSLAYIAAGMKLSNADIIASAMPRITALNPLHLEQTSRMTAPARGKRGVINFRNEGNHITLLSAESKIGDWKVTLSPMGLVKPLYSFQLALETESNLVDGGPVHVIVRFENNLSMGGWFDVRTERAGQGVTIGDPQMGLPPTCSA